MKSRYFSKPTQKQFLEMHKSIKQVQLNEIFSGVYRFGEFIIELKVTRL